MLRGVSNIIDGPAWQMGNTVGAATVNGPVCTLAAISDGTSAGTSELLTYPVPLSTLIVLGRVDGFNQH